LPKLKPKSADKSRDHFRYIASELIEAGIVPDQIDLAFIVRPENVEIATERMRERLGQDASSGLANRIATIKAAARHLKLLLKSDLDLLETFRRNCAPENDPDGSIRRPRPLPPLRLFGRQTLARGYGEAWHPRRCPACRPRDRVRDRAAHRCARRERFQH
jgi:hypothetical protein